jgi:tripartite-type tricarboxylate transporter receptor subunit TctC
MLIRSMLALLIAVASGSAATAQDYPNKPIRIIVGFAAGGIADLGARLLADHITRKTGQPVVVENRTAAAGTVAAQAVARSPADGYTLGLVLSGQLVINPFVQKQMPLDVLKELVPVAAVGEAPQMIAINAEVPAKTLKEFVALAKAKPGTLNYASSGPGTPYHMAGELFKAMSGTNLVHVPHRSSGDMRNSVIGAHVQMMFDAITVMAQGVQSGQLKALGTSGKQRSSVLPNVPTIAEAGVPGYEATIWLGMMAPAGTPKAVVDKLNAEVRKILSRNDIKEAWAKQGATPMLMSPDEFEKYLRADIQKWAEVVKISGAKPE